MGNRGFCAYCRAAIEEPTLSSARRERLRREIEKLEARGAPDDELTIVRIIVRPGESGPVPVGEVVSVCRRGTLVSRQERTL